jgi:hypothetical protein
MKQRFTWAPSDPLDSLNHDHEWGVPVQRVDFGLARTTNTLGGDDNATEGSLCTTNKRRHHHAHRS